MITVNQQGMAKTMLINALSGVHSMYVGPSGMGKSAIFNEVVTRNDFMGIILHPQVMQREDIAGVPILHDGKLQTEAMDVLDALINPPETDAKRILVLLEDFGNAPLDVQGPFMQLMQGGTIGRHKIDPRITFTLNTNDKGNFSGVSGVSEAIKTRGQVYSVRADLMPWVKDFARVKPMNEILTAFASRHWEDLTTWPERKPAMTEQIPTPRGIDKFDDTFAYWEDMNEEEQRAQCQGSVGPSMALILHTWIAEAGKLINVDDVLHDPEGCELPYKSKRDQLYMLCVQLANRAEKATSRAIMTVANRLAADSGEFSVFLTDTARATHESVLSDAGTAGIAWIKDHKDFLQESAR